MCILSVSQQRARDPIFTGKVLFTQIMLPKDWDHQLSQEACVVRKKSPCNLISPLPEMDFLQPMAWNLW
jgi:hypothetical protein